VRVRVRVCVCVCVCVCVFAQMKSAVEFAAALQYVLQCVLQRVSQ